jgi:hypothetical protein
LILNALLIMAAVEVRIGDARLDVMYGYARWGTGGGESGAAGVGEMVRFGVGEIVRFGVGDGDGDDGAGEILKCFLDSRPRCGSGRLGAAVAKKEDNEDGGVVLADFAVFVD